MHTNNLYAHTTAIAQLSAAKLFVPVWGVGIERPSLSAIVFKYFRQFKAARGTGPGIVTPLPFSGIHYYEIRELKKSFKFNSGNPNYLQF